MKKRLPCDLVRIARPDKLRRAGGGGFSLHAESHPKPQKAKDPLFCADTLPWISTRFRYRRLEREGRGWMELLTPLVDFYVTSVRREGGPGSFFDSKKREGGKKRSILIYRLLVKLSHNLDRRQERNPERCLPLKQSISFLAIFPPQRVIFTP